MHAHCNLTQPISSSAPPYLCADTGSTHTLLRGSDAPHIVRTTSTVDTLTVMLPNGHLITSIGICHLQLPHLQCPFVAHVFSDSALNTSLLSIAQLCRLGCIATFTSSEVHITIDQSTVLHGFKLPNDSLWSIPQPALFTSPSIANATQALPNDAAFIKFAHAALGSPAISTLTQAVRRGYLHSCPCLTSKMLAAHPPMSIATAKGHLDQHRQGQRSTHTPIDMFEIEDTSDIDSINCSPV